MTKSSAGRPGKQRWQASSEGPRQSAPVGGQELAFLRAEREEVVRGEDQAGARRGPPDQVHRLGAEQQRGGAGGRCPGPGCATSGAREARP